jgi:hypothetical protein
MILHLGQDLEMIQKGLRNDSSVAKAERAKLKAKAMKVPFSHSDRVHMPCPVFLHKIPSCHLAWQRQ